MICANVLMDMKYFRNALIIKHFHEMPETKGRWKEWLQLYKR